ncbi:MAG: hypothetical protein EKK48_10190 [Candidatus Melainabacteria bacterium]|nr:MAG: hypothetical protein EKK48_10190 [Candidatus Melainabacteria bacterium]
MIVPEDILNDTANRAPKSLAAHLPDRALVAGATLSSIRRGGDNGATKEDEIAQTASSKTATLTLPLSSQPPDKATKDRLGAFVETGFTFGKVEYERILGTNDLVDENWLDRAKMAAQPVCRLDLQNGKATGVMISPNLLLTNWHVFNDAIDAEGCLAQFNYRLDYSGRNFEQYYDFVLDPKRYFVSNKVLDFAIVAVSTKSTDSAASLSRYGYHRLNPVPNKLSPEEWITIIQHPSGGPRQFALRENRLIEKQDNFLWYQSDTAPGSSGAPAFNDQFQMIALHHSGVPKKVGDKYVLRDGSQVDSIEGRQESEIEWIANEGLRVSSLCDAIRQLKKDVLIDELIQIIDGTIKGDVMAESLQNKSSNGQGNQETKVQEREITTTIQPAVSTAAQPGRYGSQTPEIVVPVRIVVSIETAPPWGPTLTYLSNQPSGAPTVSRADAELFGVEKMVEPQHDTKYSNRKGYDEDFLDVNVPLPVVKKTSLVSKMDNDEYVIPYEHFSVVMNKKRRLAMFTASNLDASVKMRQPNGDKPSRKELTGLGKNDQEKWYTDPRIPQDHQLPDVFYNKDRSAFDKGHIVRREDVCWGTGIQQIIRANGDTFHTTNCSPQVANYNRSNLDGIWGKLENYVAEQNKAERLSLFAGPVLKDDDQVFHGVTDRGDIEVQIPQSFWKLVISAEDGQLKAYAFVLEQDLSSTPFEFDVTPEWAPYLVSTKQLEALLDGFELPRAIHAADQFESDSASELLHRTPIRKRRK